MDKIDIYMQPIINDILSPLLKQEIKFLIERRNELIKKYEKFIKKENDLYKIIKHNSFVWKTYLRIVKEKQEKRYNGSGFDIYYIDKGPNVLQENEKIIARFNRLRAKRMKTIKIIRNIDMRINKINKDEIIANELRKLNI